MNLFVILGFVVPLGIIFGFIFVKLVRKQIKKLERKNVHISKLIEKKKLLN